MEKTLKVVNWCDDDAFEVILSLIKVQFDKKREFKCARGTFDSLFKENYENMDISYYQRLLQE